MPRSFVGWAILIIVIVLIWKNPAGAGHLVSTAISKIGTAISNL
jgi:hypothetical protein